MIHLFQIRELRVYVNSAQTSRFPVSYYWECDPLWASQHILSRAYFRRDPSSRKCRTFSTGLWPHPCDLPLRLRLPFFLHKRTGTHWHPLHSTHIRRDESVSAHIPRVLQCVAVCCSFLSAFFLHKCMRVCLINRAKTLQCVAVCCSVLQCVAAYRSALRCATFGCSLLQSATVCCSLLQSDEWSKWSCFSMKSS